MTKRKRDEYTDRKRLRRAGWDIQKRDATAFNSGSETSLHYLTKAAVAFVLKQEGYRVGTEVQKEGAGEIDVVAYGGDGPPFAVEVETDPSDDVVADKLARYHSGEPYREVFVLDLGDAPAELAALVAWVRAEIVG